MKLYPDSKVYIFCPGNIHTGGPESLHQLASQLLSFGVVTYMFYGALPDNSFNPEDPVHEAYKKYHIPYATYLEDDAKNVKILPETGTMELYSMKEIRCVIWWMSVNNYLVNNILFTTKLLENPLSEPMFRLFSFYDSDKNIEHWFKSEYARQFLELNGLKSDKIHHVETYVSQAFLSRAAKIDLSKKKNIVAYNPKKGFEITKVFMNLAPQIEWRPIKNMTPNEVHELLSQAKVYIDFGEHPGKDRLPREATLSGCVVITGRRGAAANDVDYNIPAEFKFNEVKDTPQLVIEKIREVFENFERELDKQRAFREKELHAKKNFAAQIAEAFEITNIPPATVALVQGVSERSYTIATELLKYKDFTTKFIIDDAAASMKKPDGFIWRAQNRNYLRLEKNIIEIITREDAKFLYHEGRIQKFALLEPIDAELDEVKNFYEPNYSDVLIFNR